MMNEKKLRTQFIRLKNEINYLTDSLHMPQTKAKKA